MDRDENFGLIIWYLKFEDDEDPVRFAGLYETLEACFHEIEKCRAGHKIVQVIIEDVRR